LLVDYYEEILVSTIVSGIVDIMEIFEKKLRWDPLRGSLWIGDIIRTVCSAALLIRAHIEGGVGTSTKLYTTGRVYGAQLIADVIC
jgi:hypothetical protein